MSLRRAADQPSPHGLEAAPAQGLLAVGLTGPRLKTEQDSTRADRPLLDALSRRPGHVAAPLARARHVDDLLRRDLLVGRCGCQRESCLTMRRTWSRLSLEKGDERRLLRLQLLARFDRRQELIRRRRGEWDGQQWLDVLFGRRPAGSIQAPARRDTHFRTSLSLGGREPIGGERGACVGLADGGGVKGAYELPDALVTSSSTEARSALVPPNASPCSSGQTAIVALRNRCRLANAGPALVLDPSWMNRASLSSLIGQVDVRSVVVQ